MFFILLSFHCQKKVAKKKLGKTMLQFKKLTLINSELIGSRQEAAAGGRKLITCKLRMKRRRGEAENGRK